MYDVFFLNMCPLKKTINVSHKQQDIQPVSKPVERILEFFQKGFNSKKGAKMC